MAYTATVSTVIADVVMGYTDMAYVVMGSRHRLFVMEYLVTACIGMVYMFVACDVTVCLVIV